jgi:hypothetical protein
LPIEHNPAGHERAFASAVGAQVPELELVLLLELVLVLLVELLVVVVPVLLLVELELPVEPAVPLVVEELELLEVVAAALPPLESPLVLLHALATMAPTVKRESPHHLMPFRVTMRPPPAAERSSSRSGRSVRSPYARPILAVEQTREGRSI